MRRAAAVPLAALLVFAQGCAPPEESPPPPPNVVFIVLDTVRAANLGCHGYERNTSPNLDALAASGVHYTRAIAPAPWTLPSHASMFTGYFPIEHGAHTYLEGEDEFLEAAAPKGIPMLAEVFQRAGYDTAGYVANEGYLSPRFGFNRGFNHYYCRWMHGEQLTHLAARWMRQRMKQPFFLFINYMDAHIPYNTQVVDTLESPWPVSHDRDLYAQLVGAVMGGAEGEWGELRDQVMAQYDMGIANADHSLGRILALLEELDLAANTLVVVASDHGECLGEHGLVGHGNGVYEPLVWVPLVIRAPGQTKGKTINEPISLADLPALIFEHMGPHTEQLDLSFFPTRLVGSQVVSENYFARSSVLFNPQWGERFREVQRAWYEDPWKYIWSSRDSHALFQPAGDPGENQNRIGDAPDIAAALHQAVTNWQRGRKPQAPPKEPGAATSQDIEQLEALGYL